MKNPSQRCPVGLEPFRKTLEIESKIDKSDLVVPLVIPLKSERRLLELFRLLNPEQQQTVIDRLELESRAAATMAVDNRTGEGQE